MLPLHDNVPTRTFPIVTIGLIAANVLVFLFEVGATDESMRAMVATYGVTPAALIRDTGVSAAVSPYLTLFTSLFLHADFMHLIGNMIFLFVFGDDIEEALGWLRFIAFYFACGIGASLAFVASAPHSPIPLVGASGAIAGVLAAYLMFRPCQKVTVLLLRFIVKLSAYWVIGGWAVLQLWQISVQAQDGVAYMAHVGGLVVGAILFPLMRQPWVELFSCDEDSSEAPAGGSEGRS